MTISTRFAVAIHTSGLLAFGDCMPVTSETIARSVGTNPVVVRRVIGMLARAGVVKVRKGQHGGAVLARPAASITLDEIFRAVEPGPLFEVPLPGPGHGCVIGRQVGPVLERFFHRAEYSMLASLKGITLAEVIESVQQRVCSTNREQ